MDLPKRELEIRKELRECSDDKKPALLAALVRLVEDRRSHGLYGGATDR